MKVFKNSQFSRFAGKKDISDAELWDIVDMLEEEQAEADLGGYVYKLRKARSGEGKSGGYRIIVYFKNEERTFFIYSFAKSVLANISKKELVRHKKTAKTLMALTDKQLDDLVKTGVYTEIENPGFKGEQNEKQISK